MTAVGIIAVAYETPQHLRSFVEQVLTSSAGPQVSLVVVDNSAVADRVVAERLGVHARASYCRSGKNLGYFGGARFGFEQLCTQGELPPWIVVCNVDLRFDLDGLLRSLDALNLDERVGAVAPRLISRSTGQDMNPFFRSRPSVRRMWFYATAFKYYPFLKFYSWLGQSLHSAVSRIRGPRQTESAGSHGIQEIYAPHGAFFVLSRRYFLRGGTLDHEVFLFGEEITIAERIREVGLLTVFDPTCVIDHVDQVSTGHTLSRRTARFMYEASEYCFRAYFDTRRKRQAKSAPAPEKRGTAIDEQLNG
jgi:GT2 family glycosyltransferase